MFATLRAKGTTDNFSKVFVSAPSYFSPEYNALDRFATTASGAEAAADLRVAPGSSWIQRDKPKDRGKLFAFTPERETPYGANTTAAASILGAPDLWIYATRRTEKMCHLADVSVPRAPAYFSTGTTREGKREDSAGSDNNRGQLAPLPLLRGLRARVHRPQRGALHYLPRRHQRPAPGDAHLDKPASRRYRSSRLRVRPPRDAAPP